MNGFKRFNDFTSAITPNVEISEGVRVAQNFIAAPYLPLLGIDNITKGYKVIRKGKVLAADKFNYIVPAGLRIDIATAIADGDFDGCVNVYSAIDVSAGVKNFAGANVTAGEAVVASFFEDSDPTDDLLNEVGLPLGIAFYDVWEQNGAGYDGNPTNYKYANYNLQSGLTVLTRGYVEYPVVPDTSSVALPGLACFIGSNVKAGDIVTYGADSNLKLYSAISLTQVMAGDADDTDAIAGITELVGQLNAKEGTQLGKVFFVDTEFPKDYLEYVKTWAPNVQGAVAIDKTPGSATAGLPDNVYFAGVTDPASAKVVRINLINR